MEGDQIDQVTPPSDHADQVTPTTDHVSDHEDHETPPSPQEQLFLAVQRNDLVAASSLSRGPGVDLDATNAMCRTPLFLALENEHTAMVRMLLDAGAGVDTASYSHLYCTYETPVMTAARLRRLDYVQLLLQYGCELDGGGAGRRVEGKTALQWAATHGDTDMARLLLSHGADVNRQGMYYHTALHYATIGDQPAMVAWLLDHGARVHNNGDGRSPLHVAAVRGNEAIMRQLLATDKVQHAEDKFHFTPFSLACLRGHLGVVQLMTSTGLKFDYDDGLLRASESGHTGVMKYLIARGADVNAVNTAGERPLSIAARGQYQATQLLLESGAMMDVVDQRGYYPLQQALLRDHAYIASMLILHGADVTARGPHTDSPLQLAFSLSNPLLLKYILQTSTCAQRDPLLSARSLEEKQQETDFHRQASLRRSWGLPLQHHIWHWLLAHIHQPPALTDLARIAIRDQLRRASHSRSILLPITSLPLPRCLRNYIALEDLVHE